MSDDQQHATSNAGDGDPMDHLALALPADDDDLDDLADEDDDEVDVDALRASSQAGDEVQPDDDADPGSSPAGAASTTAARPTLQTGSAAVAASLRDMLDGNVPMFVVHRSHQHSQHLPELLGVARQQVNGQAGLGVAVRLPRMAPAAATAFLGACTAATMKVADPEIYSLAGSGSPSTPPAKAAARYPWAAAIPTSMDMTWVQGVLQSQADAGANVLLSASGWVPDTHGRVQLANTMTWVQASRTAVGDHPMFVNLSMPATWLTDATLRRELKQELVESNERLWWLRFYWPVVEPRYGQLIDAAILNGYRDLATTAALEDKIVVLPNSGLTGWMATAWGAQGFSTGTSWTEQMYGAQPIRRSTPGKPKAPPVERYFDRTILHSVPFTDHLTMRGMPNHLTCRCRFCRQLSRLPAFDRPTANLHYLLECANLTASLNHRRPGHQALRQVRDAIAFNSTLTPALTGPSRPVHLTAWDSRLP